MLSATDPTRLWFFYIGLTWVGVMTLAALLDLIIGPTPDWTPRGRRSRQHGDPETQLRLIRRALREERNP